MNPSQVILLCVCLCATNTGAAAETQAKDEDVVDDGKPSTSNSAIGAAPVAIDAVRGATAVRLEVPDLQTQRDLQFYLIFLGCPGQCLTATKTEPAAENVVDAGEASTTNGAATDVIETTAGIRDVGEDPVTVQEKVEGGGIVIDVMKNDEPWPKEGVKKYKHFLECSYRHSFKRPEGSFVYDIHCLQFEGEKNFILSINYDNNVFDNYIVTSCDLEDVVNSVFPPKMKTKYLQEEVDDMNFPKISYLTYKKINGKCYTRKYEYANRKSTAAKRYEPEETDCPGNDGRVKYGAVGHFSACRVPRLPFSNIVKSGTHPWVQNDEDRRLLKCVFDKDFKVYTLICEKADRENEYFAFLLRDEDILDRFIVNSCNEEDIVNSIFPKRETKEISYSRNIWFADEKGDCYMRIYPYPNDNEPRSQYQVDCPEEADEWLNPTMGYAGLWRSCEGKLSIKEKQKTQLQLGSENSGGDRVEGADQVEDSTTKQENVEIKGIVKDVSGNDGPLSQMVAKEYKMVLECWIGMLSDVHDIRCLKVEGESDLILSVNVDDIVLDNYKVTSCDLKDVVNSVYLPKYKPYSVTYKTTEGKCYNRKYEYISRRPFSAADRLTPEETDCPGNLGESKNEALERFTKCRVPRLPFSNTVKSDTCPWLPNEKDRRLLECTFDQFSRLFTLICEKGDHENEYFAFVSYNEEHLDRFTVKSCDEEDIASSIFPIKKTTANPSDWPRAIWFADEKGDCYKREYRMAKKTQMPIDCPKDVDDWLNPSWGFAGQWRECKGKLSNKEKQKTQSQVGSENLGGNYLEEGEEAALGSEEKSSASFTLHSEYDEDFQFSE